MYGRAPIKPGSPLGRREREVLLSKALGAHDKDTARELFISVFTVHTHIGHILTRKAARNLGHAVTIAYQNEELPIPFTSEETGLNEEHQAVLACLALGLSYAQTAEHAHFCHNATYGRVKDAYRALGARNRAHLIYRGIQTGNIVTNRRPL